MDIKNGLYRHYKGNEYTVLGVAVHSETGEKFVVYRACYGEKRLWIRPADMFSETIIKDGKEIRRFELIKPFDCN